MAGSNVLGKRWWQTRSEGNEKWFESTEGRSAEGSQVTGRKQRKRKMKIETSICRESCFKGVLHFQEQLLTSLYLVKSKGRFQVLASALAVVFVPVSTLASNAVQEKHIHREESS